MRTNCRKRKLFALILGTVGFTFIIMANILKYESSHRIFVLTTIFHNNSMSYFTSMNLNLSVVQGNEQIWRQSFLRTEVKDEYSQTSSRLEVKHAGIFELVNTWNEDRRAAGGEETLSKLAQTAMNPTRNIHPRVTTAQKTSAFEFYQNCTTRNTGVEDILCMKPPTFLPDFRNPCWYQSGSLHCLPYFHIIGVCKTGTTDLFERLTYHPQILKNRGILGKETWYWTWKRYGHSNFYKKETAKTTIKQFVSMFDAKAIKQSGKANVNGKVFHPTITGHGDPMDFWDQTSWRQIPQNDPSMLVPLVTTPALVKHINPGVKLILLLRDPVERLFSNYLHGQFGKDAIQFHDDVMSSLTVLQPCAHKLTMRVCLYSKDLTKSLKVPISGSFYYIHLLEWLKVFPREQIFITRSEDFSDDVAGTLLNIFRFLRVDPLTAKSLHSIGHVPHMYDTKGKTAAGNILNETRRILEEVFEPYNKELADLLNSDKYLWKKDS